MVPKFRAWDIKYKMMMRVNQIDFEKKTVWPEADNGDHENRHTLTREFKDVIFMQSTGLKDKNGAEIFEGDIIVWEYSEKPQEVFWDNSICGFSTKHYHLWRTVKKVKVIGNIYENPELLEPANEN